MAGSPKIKKRTELQSLSTLPVLKKLSASDRRYFENEFLKKIPFTQSQIRQILEWLWDLAKREDASFCKLTEKLEFFKNLDDVEDLRFKAETVFSRVRLARFPESASRMEKFEQFKRKHFGGMKKVRIEPVSGFDEPGLRLTIQVNNSEEIKTLAVLLRKKIPSLKTLFEMTI